MFDVAVIGAGVVGALAARELSRYAVKTVLLEKADDVAMGASKANSAIVHAGFDCIPGTLMAKMNVKGNAMMETVAAELSVPFKRNGSMVLAFGPEDEKTLADLKERGEKNGVPGLKILSGDEARALEPKLSPDVTAALLAPSGGIVCPYELTIAAAGNAMDNGVELKCNFEVADASFSDGSWTLTAVSGETVQARYIVNAAGIYSDIVAGKLGDFYTVRPRRGEYLLLDREQGSTVSHTIFQCPSAAGKGVLVTPTVDGNLLLGPTSVYQDDREDHSTTAEGLSDVARLAAKSIPTVNTRAVITSFTGLRSARLYITAHGLYRLTVNGVRPDGREFAPENTSYHKILLYQTYDLTPLLREGKNVLGVILGDGWWAGRVGTTGDSCQYGDRLGLLLELRADYQDGHTQRVTGEDPEDPDDRSQLLGWPDVIQNSMFDECDLVSQGYYLGDGWLNIPKEVRQRAEETARDRWMLLFQLDTVEQGDFELMFGDCGHIYFYITKEDLAARRFDRIWLVLQCC